MTSRNRLKSLGGWALYDFANTIFSAIVLTFYFPLYLTDLTQRNWHLGIASTLAMVLAGLFVPWLGALSDRTGKTKRYLVTATLLCVLFTSLLSVLRGVPLLVTAFLLACFFFHASLVFYSSLLPVVAPPERQGLVSGLGTGLGYLGVIFSIPIAHAVDLFFGRQFVFFLAGGLFLLFSLPLFLWVPERKIENPVSPTLGLLVEEWKKVFRTAGALRRNKPLLYFFLGNFFLVDAVNTVIFWMVIYISGVFHPSANFLVVLYLTLNFSAFLCGLLAGFLTDRVGTQRILLASALSLFVTFLALGLSTNLWIFTGFAITGGAFSLAGVWTAGRKRVVEFAPLDSVGEYFGLYNLTTKVSVVGSLVFSLLADRLGFRAALLSGLVPTGLGLFFLWRGEASRRNASRYPSS